MSGELTQRKVVRGGVISLLGNAGGMCVSMLAESVPEGSMSFNFDPMKPENFRLLDAIDEPATREQNQHATEPFQLVYWSLKKVMLAAKGDEPERLAVRCVLIDTEGETLEFVSKGVLTSLDSIRLRYGDGPYDPALPVTVTEVKLPNKFYMTKLRVVSASNGSTPAA